MFSAPFARVTEDHDEELTRVVISDLQSNPRTPAYERLSRKALPARAFDVYRSLGNWLGVATDEAIEAKYHELGKRRSAESGPLSEVIYALILTKYHLRNYIPTAGLVGSVVALYQEQELQRLVGQLFDKAIYYAARAYERKASPHQATKAEAPAS